ncbi:MAG: hypothetical protein RL026_2264 [Pseudomonadota bacterium]|jgi:type II secretory pathway pseudopilin PulG
MNSGIQAHSAPLARACIPQRSDEHGSSLPEALLALLILALAGMALARSLPRDLHESHAPLQQLRAAEVAAGLLEEASLGGPPTSASPTLQALPALSAGARLQSDQRPSEGHVIQSLDLVWPDAQGRLNRQQWSQVPPPAPVANAAP